MRRNKTARGNTIIYTENFTNLLKTYVFPGAASLWNENHSKQYTNYPQHFDSLLKGKNSQIETNNSND